jgi:hypothetical protein
MRLATLFFITFFICGTGTSTAEVADIDDGAPENLDDEIRRSSTPPEYLDQKPDGTPQRSQGPYIYDGYPYPFIHPFYGMIGNINPPLPPPNGKRP